MPIWRSGWKPDGQDELEFLISSNAGEEPKPLAKIASGGELSRVMLSIKNVLAQKDRVGTAVFDEIDTGVSGKAAQKIGQKLQEVSCNRQVICVTHLAQVAVYADHHLLIEKSEEDGRTYTRIKPLDRQGRVDYGDFVRLIRPNTKAIVCTHASNLTGNILDVGRIGKIAHEHGLMLFVDASQTAGCLPIDMAKLSIDVLCFTGHKGLLGPQGTGGLCVGEGVELKPFKRGGSGVHSYERRQPMEYPTRLEAGTLNSHSLAGLGAALKWIEETGVETIARHEQQLTLRFYEGVRQIDGVTVYGDFVSPHAGIVSLNVRDYDSGAVADALSTNYGIATRAGAHCAPRMHQALGTVEQGAVRFSFGYFTTPDEVDAAIQAVEEIASLP